MKFYNIISKHRQPEINEIIINMSDLEHDEIISLYEKISFVEYTNDTTLSAGNPAESAGSPAGSAGKPAYKTRQDITGQDKTRQDALAVATEENFPVESGLVESKFFLGKKMPEQVANCLDSETVPTDPRKAKEAQNSLDSATLPPDCGEENHSEKVPPCQNSEALPPVLGNKSQLLKKSEISANAWKYRLSKARRITQIYAIAEKHKQDQLIKSGKSVPHEKIIKNADAWAKGAFRKFLMNERELDKMQTIAMNFIWSRRSKKNKDRNCINSRKLISESKKQEKILEEERDKFWGNFLSLDNDIRTEIEKKAREMAIADSPRGQVFIKKSEFLMPYIIQILKEKK